MNSDFAEVSSLLTADSWHVTADSWHVTADSWHVTANSWHVTANSWHVTADSWHVAADSWHVAADSSHVTADSWHVAADSWHVAADSWHVAADSWHVTADSWHVAADSWHVAADSWHVAADSWHVAADSWHVTDDSSRFTDVRLCFAVSTRGSTPTPQPQTPMRLTQAVVLTTLVSVQRFLDANAESLAAVNRSQLRTSLDNIVETLSAPSITRVAGKRIAAIQAARERSLRDSLKRNHMRPIATVAAALLRGVPESRALKMPPRNGTSRTLIDRAGNMATAAGAHTKALVDAGLPADFVSSLTGAADALTAAIASRQVTRYGPPGATRLTAIWPRARDVVEALDSLIEPRIAGDAALLAQWQAAKRFGGATRVTTTPTVATSTSALAPDASPLDAGLAIPAEAVAPNIEKAGAQSSLLASGEVTSS